MSSVADLLARVRWLRRSSSLRLTLLLSAIFATGLIVAIFLALIFGRNAILERVDTTLAGVAAGLIANDTPSTETSILIQPLSSPNDLPKAFRAVALQGVRTVRFEEDFRGSEAWRVTIAPDQRGDPVLIAIAIDDSEDALDLLTGTLWTAAGLMLAFALVVGFSAGLLAERRLSRINTVLEVLSAGDLQARTGVDRSKDDLDDLARQLDKTADDLERLVAQTRNLSASLAHDLRTPLARLRARIEALPQGEERGAALEEASRLSEIFDTIMRVARIEAVQGTKGLEPVDLGRLVSALSETFGPVIEDSGKQMILKQGAPRTVDADRNMLVQAMANLIQNAIVHGGNKIELFAIGSEIGVSDNGAGVDPSHYSEIVKPMVRLDEARHSDGSGLGLALVRAVAERHGAELKLDRALPSGLRVSVKFTNL